MLPTSVHTLYLLSVFIHILTATIWVGGMMFLVLVVVPWLRSDGRNVAGRFLMETGIRFRNVGWWCFVTLLVTGTFNLWFRGVRFGDFVNPEWLATAFGKSVVLKLALFLCVLLVSGIHDFVVGPRATKALLADPASAETQALRKQASRLGRANAMLGLSLLVAAVLIVRGAPW